MDEVSIFNSSWTKYALEMNFDLTYLQKGGVAAAMRMHHMIHWFQFWVRPVTGNWLENWRPLPESGLMSKLINDDLFDLCNVIQEDVTTPYSSQVAAALTVN